jgi:hypothetical protein
VASLVVDLLAERPEGELRKLRDKGRAELARVERERARVEVELAQLEEALQRQQRRSGSARRTAQRSGPTVRDRVRAIFENSEGTKSPSEITTILQSEGYSGSKSGVYNALAYLLDESFLAKAGDGLYELASQNGGSAAESGPTENESGATPLSAETLTGGL